MVDLVKIRKKAKKADKSEQVAASSDQPTPRQSGSPAVKPPREPDTPRPRDPETPRPRDPDRLEKYKAGAGRKREGFIREAAAASAAQQLEMLTFALAGEQYAVAIEHILQIVTPRPTTRVPNADPSVVGIISLRGLIVTVVDVRARLRHPPARAGAGVRIIVVERGGETLGFEVDHVLRVVKVDAGDVEPHPVVHASEQTEAIRGVFRHAGSLTILLDLDKLLA